MASCISQNVAPLQVSLVGCHRSSSPWSKPAHVVSQDSAQLLSSFFAICSSCGLRQHCRCMSQLTCLATRLTCCSHAGTVPSSHLRAKQNLFLRTKHKQSRHDENPRSCSICLCHALFAARNLVRKQHFAAMHCPAPRVQLLAPLRRAVPKPVVRRAVIQVERHALGSKEQASSAAEGCPSKDPGHALRASTRRSSIYYFSTGSAMLTTYTVQASKLRCSKYFKKSPRPGLGWSPCRTLFLGGRRAPCQKEGIYSPSHTAWQAFWAIPLQALRHFNRVSITCGV